MSEPVARDEKPWYWYILRTRTNDDGATHADGWLITALVVVAFAFCIALAVGGSVVALRFMLALAGADR